MRVHGLKCPLHPLQVLSWVVVTADIAGFSVLGLPLLNGDVARVVTAVLFVACTLVLLLAAARATICDPADPRSRGGTTSDHNTQLLLKCAYCEQMVLDSSHHCKACGKCVQEFDHHCMWLNNCIGKKNYSAFVWSIGSVAAMTGVMLASCVALVLEYLLDNSRLTKDLEELYGGVVREAALAVWIGLITVNLPLFLLDGQLIVLHLFLLSRSLTTYQYIQLKRQELREKEDKTQGGAGFSLQGRSLPRCMDWIVFSYRRTRQRRSRRISPTDVAGIEAAKVVEASAEEGNVPVHHRLPPPLRATSTGNAEAVDVVQACSDSSTSNS
mmetsp:Transcript_98230/g.194587  ORF Transcript_98230/g.194587 Transcript_98230/m.194587 type:complete len:327 (+) Transcript_98230:83-1063(+)